MGERVPIVPLDNPAYGKVLYGLLETWGVPVVEHLRGVLPDCMLAKNRPPSRMPLEEVCACISNPNHINALLRDKETLTR